MESDDTGEQLITAALHGELQRVRALVAAGMDVNHVGETTPLHAAIESMHAPTIQFLLDSGADPNLAIRGWPPLHHAVDVEIDSVLQSLQRAPSSRELPEPSVTCLLLAAGADPARGDADGETAIEFAAGRGHDRAVQAIRAHTQVT